MKSCKSIGEKIIVSLALVLILVCGFSFFVFLNAIGLNFSQNEVNFHKDIAVILGLTIYELGVWSLITAVVSFILFMVLAVILHRSERLENKKHGIALNQSNSNESLSIKKLYSRKGRRSQDGNGFYDY